MSMRDRPVDANTIDNGLLRPLLPTTSMLEISNRLGDTFLGHPRLHVEQSQTSRMLQKQGNKMRDAGSWILYHTLNSDRV